MIKLIEPPKERFSWANEILKMKEGDKVKARKQFAGSIAPVISRDIKLKAPDREYSIDTKSEPNYIIIEFKKAENEDLKETTH
ncbi:hypothetical protein [Pedobacter metabolipauper]|uniref:Uncharacterized protein n=1 Tax=Pedobacter metabolipauper TaxID=425513 RepID=A0A4R6T3V4_9SPHI|nr:hypothetical protein [Pedobacter metabolipauper]TDQ12802.1 hypothetical protein ATK78_0009 [Pedobacter metabolipauper]